MERAKKSSRRDSNGEQNVDRLSALPDGLIGHILSFLPTKLSMETSILAKRWRFLWAHVLVLRFECDYVNSKRARSFPGIVNTVLLRHKVRSLNTFRLTYFGDPMGCYELEACIATVVERNVQNLYLALIVEVPRCLLTCKTLVDLTMSVGVSIPPSAPISLPNLKKLLLLRLYWEEVDITRLLSGCPVLEELIINGTTCRDPRGCCISSPTLKRLTIINLLASCMFNNPDYMVTINTPALRYLKVRDGVWKHISISLCTSLVEADIYIGSLCELDDFYHQCVLMKLLDSIRNVKCLDLTAYCEEVSYGLMLSPIAKFDNLIKLEFSATWCFLSKFLESTDHLQVLIIREGFWESKPWMEPIEERCACLLYSLRTVRIDDFSLKEQSFNMVRYILRNALVLERMEIYCQLGLEEKFDAIQRISLFRRGSMECEVAFS